MKRLGLAILATAALAGGTACSDDDGDAGEASQLVYVSGDGQEGAPGTLLAQPLVVEVLNDSDDPVEGVQLHWELEGGGSLSQANTTTGADGRSSVTLTLGNAPGAHTVVVSVPGLDIDDVVFGANATDPGDGGGGGGGEL